MIKKNKNFDNHKQKKPKQKQKTQNSNNKQTNKQTTHQQKTKTQQKNKTKTKQKVKKTKKQVSWIGYPNTTGLTQIDFRLTDSFVDPPSTPQQYAEKLWRLPRTFLCYSPSVSAKETIPSVPPMTRNGFCTFGSFNALSKINSKVRLLWARVLLCLPTSRLVVKSKGFVDDGVRAKFLESFEALGVASSRIDLLSLVPQGQHFRAYSLMDVSLDTFPYSGTTTTCECLFQGVPVVTLRSKGEGGGNHCHNVSAGIVTVIGQQSWACSSEGEYVTRAVELGSDPAKLSEIRESLRDWMGNSPLCDGKTMACDVETAFGSMCQEIFARDVDTSTTSE